MLELAVGPMKYLQRKNIIPEVVINAPATWFDSVYEVEWLNTPYAKHLIKEIDNSTYVQDHIIMSPYLGAITPSQLSGGVKVLISLMNNPDLFIRLNSCGDNCIPALAEISRKYNCKAYVEYIPVFNRVKDVDILVLNTGKHYTNGMELFLDIAELKADIINEIGNKYDTKM